MLTKRIAKNISGAISNELSLTSGKREIIEYGIEGILSQLLSVFFLLVTAYVLGIFKEVIFVAIPSIVLRRYSGGYHSSTPLGCALLGAIVIPIVTFIGVAVYKLNTDILSLILIIVNLLTLLLYGLYAPKDSISKPIRNKDKIKKLKIKSVICSSIVFIISIVLFYNNLGQASILISLGSFNQAMTLTRFGGLYIKLFDQIIKLILQKGVK